MVWVVVAAVVGFLVGTVLTWGYMVNQIDNMALPPPVTDLPPKSSEQILATGYRYNPVSRKVEKR